ncbi:MAG: hypothetical protein ACYTFK_10775 [Planctomycetota bacterium]|jgi:hypothetical protein
MAEDRHLLKRLHCGDADAMFTQPRIVFRMYLSALLLTTISLMPGGILKAIY